VSRGGEKNFREFTIRLKERGQVKLDGSYFIRLVAKAILFRRAEAIVQEQEFGGYRANIVAYSLAYLSFVTAQRIDLDRVWRDQNLSAALRDAITLVSRHVHGSIIKPPDGANVTEWCKKEDCWKSIRALQVNLPAALHDELLASGPSNHPGVIQQNGPVAVADTQLIDRLRAISSDRWFEISKWAKETGNLQPWQRSLAYSMGRLVANNKNPSAKQATQAVKILDAVSELGFRLA
jgi:hypothetical protein